MNLFYLSASGFVNRQRDPSRFRRWLMAHFGREAVRAWVKRNIVDWAPDDPEHRDESHAEARYAEAERRHKVHTVQMEKFAAAEAAGHDGVEPPQESDDGDSPDDEATGSLASDAQLAALREKLAGNA